MPYSLDWCDELNADMEALSNYEFALWDQVMELITENDLALEELGYPRGHWNCPGFNVVVVGELIQLGLNIQRLKLIDPTSGRSISSFRLLYAIDHTSGPKIHLLGLMPRHEDFQPSGRVVSRCINSYDALGFRRLL